MLKAERRWHRLGTKTSQKKVLAVIGIITVLSGTLFFTWYYMTNANPSSQVFGTYHRLDLSPYNWAMVEHGKIYNRSGLLVMDLNGSYAQMGYAHGQLVGPLIRYSIEVTFQMVFSGNKTTYDWYHDIYVNSHFTINSTYHSKELDAIHQACVDRGYNMIVPSLGRSWDVIDLWMMNLGYELGLLLGVNTSHCSSFGVFGSAALDAKNFIGRNFDDFQDPAGYLTQLNLIIIFRGNGSRNDVVSFAYPGEVGILSGFNSKGVWADSDNSNGDFNDIANRTSISVALRNFLEHENSSHVATDAIEFFTSQNALSPFLILIGTNQSSSKPIFVLEGNDYQVAVRNETAPDHEYIAMTTYQLVLEEPIVIGHYQTLMWDLGNLTTTGDTKVSPDEGLQMLKDVSWAPSVVSIIFFPSTLEFRVGYGSINVGDGEPWTRNDIVRAQWSQFINTTIDYHDL